MKAVDIVIKKIDESGMTQNEAAKLVGVSRQNLWDKLNKGNPRFNSMERIMNAFGYEIRIRGSFGMEPSFNQQQFFETIREQNPGYDMLESIVSAMDYKLEIVEKAGK